MSTTVRGLPEHQRYEIEVDGERVGLLSYRRDGERITMHHTEVDPAFSGQGLALELVQFALNEALTEGTSVLPTCTYVAKTIREDPDRYLELVPEGERHRFDL
ncbi:GNAT family N-acetyltransferase [Demetria terragena]|uniref:GNAT family N-acetyltransferase n=1 Tax=Demetria terragena TaxID=63959 RepID=UPI00037F017D|nr:GNAT family N-acetyltransferase [Demetria terragena]